MQYANGTLDWTYHDSGIREDMTWAWWKAANQKKKKNENINMAIQYIAKKGDGYFPSISINTQGNVLFSRKAVDRY